MSEHTQHVIMCPICDHLDDIDDEAMWEAADELYPTLAAECDRHHVTVEKVWQRTQGDYCIQLFQEVFPYPDGSGRYITCRHTDLASMYQTLIQYLKHTEDLDMNIFKTGLFDHMVGEMLLNDKGVPKIVPMTITKVAIDSIHDGRGGSEDKPVIHFKESDKTLVLNKSNARNVVSLYGPETDNWIGQRIAVSGEKGRWFGKDQTRVIILASKPSGSGKQQKDEPSQEEMARMVAEHEEAQKEMEAADDQQEVAAEITQEEIVEETPEDEGEGDAAYVDEAGSVAEDVTLTENEKFIYDSTTVEAFTALVRGLLPYYTDNSVIQAAMKEIGYPGGLNDLPYISGKHKKAETIEGIRQDRLKVYRELEFYAATKGA